MGSFDFIPDSFYIQNGATKINEQWDFGKLCDFINTQYFNDLPHKFIIRILIDKIIKYEKYLSYLDDNINLNKSKILCYYDSPYAKNYTIEEINNDKNKDNSKDNNKKDKDNKNDKNEGEAESIPKQKKPTNMSISIKNDSTGKNEIWDFKKLAAIVNTAHFDNLPNKLIFRLLIIKIGDLESKLSSVSENNLENDFLVEKYMRPKNLKKLK